MILYVDGGCSGNGQRDLSQRDMIAVVTDEHGTVLIDKHRYGGSNNIAELWAVHEALAWCLINGVAESVQIVTDSKNNLAWVYGKRLGKKLNDRVAVETLKREISRHMSRMNVSIVWCPREENLAGHYIERRYAL